MNDPGEFSTRLNKEQARAAMEAWANCLPKDLSGLFFNVGHHELSNPVTRIDRYRAWGDLINKLQELGSESVERIRIYMGASPKITEPSPENMELPTYKFSPIFTIVLNDEKPIEPDQPKYLYYGLVPSTEGEFKGYPRITSAVSDLFQRKWRELDEEEITMAFTGLTCDKIEEKEGAPHEYQGQFRSHRVRYYDFTKEDAREIIEKVSRHSSPKVEVFLGAGLTVQITHPFNFRPIIAVSSQQDGMALDEEDEECFERSQPCPPFCHNGIGSY